MCRIALHAQVKCYIQYWTKAVSKGRSNLHMKVVQNHKICMSIILSFFNNTHIRLASKRVFNQ